MEFLIFQFTDHTFSDRLLAVDRSTAHSDRLHQSIEVPIDCQQSIDDAIMPVRFHERKPCQIDGKCGLICNLNTFIADME